MPFKDDLERRVWEFAVENWGDIPNAHVLPEAADLAFGNAGEHLDVTVVYADLSGSTKLVDSVDDTLAAEYYKAFLHCASQIFKRRGGKITAYDGDRVMAMFVGAGQGDLAVGSALELHFAVDHIINPNFSRIYKHLHHPLAFTVGIDSGRVLAIKVGVRAVGELAWIGPAANYAAKLNSFEGLDHDFPIRVTRETLVQLTDAVKLGPNGSIWDGPYENVGKRQHYRTSYMRSF